MNEWVYVLPFGIAAILGLRGSMRLTLRYRAVADRLDDRERWILLADGLVAWVITVAAVFYGVLAVRAMLGFERIPELTAASVLIATVVLFIPAFLDAVVTHVARVPWDE